MANQPFATRSIPNGISPIETRSAHSSEKHWQSRTSKVRVVRDTQVHPQTHYLQGVQYPAFIITAIQPLSARSSTSQKPQFVAASSMSSNAIYHLRKHRCLSGKASHGLEPSSRTTYVTSKNRIRITSCTGCRSRTTSGSATCSASVSPRQLSKTVSECTAWLA